MPTHKLTQLQPAAVPGRRHGSFAGKAGAAAGAHPVGKLAQLSPAALPGRRYGNFAGKGAAAGGVHLVGKLTQLALRGGPGRRYRAFGGKRPAIAPAPPPPARRRGVRFTHVTRDRLGWKLAGGGTPPRSREEIDRDH
jgi:hypothetical protein